MRYLADRFDVAGMDDAAGWDEPLDIRLDIRPDIRSGTSSCTCWRT
jgi:hypothetical protein